MKKHPEMVKVLVDFKSTDLNAKDEILIIFFYL